MRQIGRSLLLVLVVACGPDPDKIISDENKKLTDLEPVEAAKVEEALTRIRYESEIIAKGGVLPLEQDSIVADTITASVPETPAPEPITRTQDTFPHHIQVGAYTTAQGAKSAAEVWEKRGFPNVIFTENPNSRSEYRFVVQLTGFPGYSSAFAESNRINAEYNIRSYPIQIR